MGLSEQLISQFAKTVNANNKNTTANSPTVYGKVLVRSGQKYVQLDGSDQYTPVETTVSVSDGDRVAVKMENHTATVTGNLSDPSASSAEVTKSASQISEFEIIIAHRVTTEELAATNAYIENLRAISAKYDEMFAVTAEIEELQAKMATIDHLTATDIEALNAEIENLRATFGTFEAIDVSDLNAVNAEIDNLKAYVGNFTYVSTDQLDAIKANIKQLDADKLTAKDADIKYAKIDFANIGEAAIKKLFADSGIIKDIIVSDGKITGELVGVTIKGDLIEAGTLKADKLVIKGEDGLYYKLNMVDKDEDGNLDPDFVETEYNSLDGSHIITKSVTAEKIAVDDLVAFDATIGGFHMGSDKIYSGVKESIDNSTQGICITDDGQMNLGDAFHYVKYYRDAEGNYKLEISAESVLFGSENKSIESAISDASDILNQTINEKNDQLTDRINGMDKDLQDKLALLNGYIHIDPDNATITLGKSSSPITLKIEHDMIGFYKNGKRFGWWDGDDFYTGNIVVEVDERAQFGNFAFTPRSDGSLSLLKVADYLRFMITRQPVEVSAKVNTYASYSVDAVGEGLSYQWQFAISPWYIWENIDSSFTSTTGYNTKNLKFYCDSEFLNSIGSEYKYVRCAITDNTGETIYSNEAMLLVEW